jgi:hypothetical protein
MTLSNVMPWNTKMFSESYHGVNRTNGRGRIFSNSLEGETEPILRCYTFKDPVRSDSRSDSCILFVAVHPFYNPRVKLETKFSLL